MYRLLLIAIILFIVCIVAKVIYNKCKHYYYGNNRRTYYAFVEWCENNNIAKARQCINAGLMLNNKDKIHVLIQASRNNNVEIVDYIVSLGVMPNQPKRIGIGLIPGVYDTPSVTLDDIIKNNIFVRACINGCLEIAKYYASMGLVCNDEYHHVYLCALDMSCESNQLDVIKFLINSGLSLEDIKANNCNIQTCNVLCCNNIFMKAFNNGYVEILDYFIRLGMTGNDISIFIKSSMINNSCDRMQSCLVGKQFINVYKSIDYVLHNFGYLIDVNYL